jgi:hypothetical protein
LAIQEKALGPEHPDVALSLNGLAELCRSQGRDSEAEPLYLRALAIREKALGPDHPQLAPSLESLAALYKETNRVAAAEALQARAASVRAIQR